MPSCTQLHNITHISEERHMEHANDIVTLLALLGMLVAIHIRIRKV